MRPGVEPLEHPVPRKQALGSLLDAWNLLRAAETMLSPARWSALQWAAKGIPAPEIAERLGLATANAVNLRISRSRRKLARIEDQIGDGTDHYAAGLPAFAVAPDGTETALNALPSRCTSIGRAV